MIFKIAAALLILELLDRRYSLYLLTAYRNPWNGLRVWLSYMLTDCAMCSPATEKLRDHIKANGIRPVLDVIRGRRA